ncbi:hypothetical protein A0H81_07243 [Grifola frondosa]|uniref:Uncharacterized protein n=1 Tax=Grifola frondosa TaxID=5627 RepID=A0A1C7M828_GRIFR|nr:hypothetical protein A0H81_07243 [Grifola frondosa]
MTESCAKQSDAMPRNLARRHPLRRSNVLCATHITHSRSEYAWKQHLKLIGRLKKAEPTWPQHIILETMFAMRRCCEHCRDSCLTKSYAYDKSFLTMI